MSYQTLRYEVEDGLLLLTLNRPDNLNAFTVEMAMELVAAYQRASDDDSVGSIVVTGAGKEGVAAFLEKRSPEFTAKASAMPPFCEEWPTEK